MFLFDCIPKSQCILLDQFRFIGLFEIRRHQSVTCAMGKAVKWENWECCEFALIVVRIETFHCTIPQSASLTAPFTQGSLGLCLTFGRSVKLRFVMLFEVCTRLLPLPPGEVPPVGRGRGMCRQWVVGCSFV